MANDHSKVPSLPLTAQREFDKRPAKNTIPLTSIAIGPSYMTYVNITIAGVSLY
jgi:hypothetical protein